MEDLARQVNDLRAGAAVRPGYSSFQAEESDTHSLLGDWRRMDRCIIIDAGPALRIPDV